MDSHPAQPAIQAKQIAFSNGNSARSVIAYPGADPEGLIQELGISYPQSLIVVAGGAGSLDPATIPRLTQLFSRGIARAAAESGAAIIDGGTQAGVMALMGQGVADRGHKNLLLGVVPNGKATYPGGPPEGSIPDGCELEPNHTHFVLVRSENWGDETRTLFALASSLARPPAHPPELPPPPPGWWVVPAGLMQRAAGETARRETGKGANRARFIDAGGPSDRIGTFETVESPNRVGVFETVGSHNRVSYLETGRSPHRVSFVETGESPNRVSFIETVGAPGDPGSAGIVAAPNHPGMAIPVVTVLAGGSLQGVARQEVLLSVRQGWPVIILEGSGELADRLARLARKTQAEIEDPDLAEIVQDGNLQVFSDKAPVRALEHLLARLLSGSSVLKLAWERFSTFDENAKRHRDESQTWQVLIISLGVLITALVLVQTTLQRADLAPALTQIGLSQDVVAALTNRPQGFDLGLRVIIIALPLISSALLAFSTRFNAASKYVLLRSAAEAVKREIFRYRTRPRNYALLEAQPEPANPQKGTQPAGEPLIRSREAGLAENLEAISDKLMKTHVNMSALIPYQGPIPPHIDLAAGGDDGLSFLTPGRYIQIRIGDQLSFFHGRTARLEKQLRRLQGLILIAGGLGAFLAAVGLELWVALTTSLASAFATYLGYRQVENTLIQYNQTATNLENVRAWWRGLSPEQQADPKNVDLLVKYTEEFLESETTGWVQQMQNALDKLRKEQAGAAEQGGAPNQSGG